jgi:hypothetical protein
MTAAAAHAGRPAPEILDAVGKTRTCVDPSTPAG